MPCAICEKDASETDVLKNGKAELKRFFCRQCVQQKQDAGEAKGGRGGNRGMGAGRGPHGLTESARGQPRS